MVMNKLIWKRAPFGKNTVGETLKYINFKNTIIYNTTVPLCIVFSAKVEHRLTTVNCSKDMENLM